MYKIEYDKRIVKILKKFPKREQKAILKKIESLAKNPRQMGVKALQGNLNGLYRVRVGDYRIIYNVEDKILTIYVLKIGQRGQVYED